MFNQSNLALEQNYLRSLNTNQSNSSKQAASDKDKNLTWADLKKEKDDKQKEMMEKK